MKKMIFTLVLFLSVIGIEIQAQDCTLTTPPFIGESCTFINTLATSNFIVPPGYSVTVRVQAWGGGGGGGNQAGRQAGGGGGGYAEKAGITLLAGSHSVTVGGGGAVGVQGGTSQLLDGSIVMASGGSPANDQIGGAGGGGFGDSFFTGGAGATSTTGNDGGGGGGGAGSTGNGGAGAVPTGGTGGTGGGGNGGNGGTNAGANGTVGSIPGGGGGGSGGGSGGVSGFGGRGEVIITVTDVALPVELLSLRGETESNSISLNWETASELNNEKFVIEHSIDGRTFSPIGEVKGSGSTVDKQYYQFTHKTPARGKNYYRLQQVDFDGQYVHSHIETVEFDIKGEIAIFPTATNGKLSIQSVEENKASVKVYDLTGAMIISQSFTSSNNMEIDLSAHSNGIYIVTVEMGGQVYRERVLKF